jgi:hypothetical protein
MVCFGGAIKVCTERGDGTVPTYNNRVNNPPQNNNNTSAGNGNSVFFNPVNGGTSNNGAVGGVNSGNSNGGVIVNLPKPTPVNQIVIPINIVIIVGQPGQVYLPVIPRNDTKVENLYVQRGVKVPNYLEKPVIPRNDIEAKNLYIKRGVKVLNYLEKKD